MNKKLSTAVISSVMLFSSVTPSLAFNVDGLQQRMQNITNRWENREASAESRTENRCERINSRIDQRINNYEEKKNQHLGGYQGMVTRWTSLADRLAAAGYNVTQFRTDLGTLSAMVTDASAKYATFIDQLKATKDLTCGKSNGEFMKDLGVSQSDLKTFRTQMLAIANFITKTIIPDFQALRAQKPTPTATVSPTSAQ